MLFSNVELTSIAILSVFLAWALKKTIPQIWVKKFIILCINLVVLSQLISFRTMFYIAVVSLIVYVSAGKLIHDQLIKDKKSLVCFITFLLISLLLITKYNWAQEFVLQSKFSDIIDGVKLVQSIGLSYVFFKLLHFLIDSYKNLLPGLDIVTFLNYIFFFPTYLAGPMDRYQNFHKWMNNESSRKEGLFFWVSLYRLFVGIIKKYALEPLVTNYAFDFNSVHVTNNYPLDALLSLMAYSLYIYLNFSGYSDIAIGTGMLLGFRVPENFRNPYFAKNISEFWKRWHITLSSILKEYIFIPFVQSMSRRFDKAPRVIITILGYIVTFSVSGIWHGSTLNFLIWGMWHAVGLVIYRCWRIIKKKELLVNHNILKIISVGASIVVTFVFVSIGWLFFHYSVDEISTLKYSLQIKASAEPYYFQGYGWGININYQPPCEKVNVDVEYRSLESDKWERYFSDRSSEYNFVHIHGSNKYNDTLRNLSPGEYEVRIRYNKNGASTRWAVSEVVIPNYESSGSCTK